jgi:hypothetical protein
MGRNFGPVIISEHAAILFRDNTEAERFDNAVRNILTVSKEEIQRREAESQKAQAKRLSKRSLRLENPNQGYFAGCIRAHF